MTKEEFPNDTVSHRNQFPLGFGDFGSLDFDTLNSFGVCAKNSVRDITGKDACALAELIFSAIFR